MPGKKGQVMIVFMLHGYPNGCSMFGELVKRLLKHGHIPVLINYRTGTSVDDNEHLIREVLSSYPPDREKAVVAHDWGAAMAWRLYDDFESAVGNYSRFSLNGICNNHHTGLALAT